MTTTNTPECATAIPSLLFCLFCGAPRQHQGNYGDTRDGLHRFVACTKCAANIYRYRQTQNEADAALYEAWNARVNTHDALQAENERLREQVKELREGLKPFAEVLQLKFKEPGWVDTDSLTLLFDGNDITVGDLRRARALLTPQEPNNG